VPEERVVIQQLEYLHYDVDWDARSDRRRPPPVCAQRQ
jgi:hypothetical protein